MVEALGLLTLFSTRGGSGSVIWSVRRPRFSQSVELHYGLAAESTGAASKVLCQHLQSTCTAQHALLDCQLTVSGNSLPLPLPLSPPVNTNRHLHNAAAKITRRVHGCPCLAAAVLCPSSPYPSRNPAPPPPHKKQRMLLPCCPACFCSLQDESCTLKVQSLVSHCHCLPRSPPPRSTAPLCCADGLHACKGARCTT